MPPKRRKLSLDDIVYEGKRLATENETDTDLTVKPCDGSDKYSEAAEKENRKSKARTSADVSAEVKVKEDTSKPTRISERLSIKRNRLGDAEEAESQVQVPVQNQTTPKKPKPARPAGKPATGKKNKRRPWAQWSIRDKKLFFNGIGEFGKNFEAISNKISHAAKQRGLPLKDKMQVRYFYYRCWAKISKFIHLNDKGVKMKTPELYGLINYGVLEKHVNENDPQFGKCLNELILHGETTYRARNARGKRTRVGKIRTPICTYLKKINKIEDKRASEVASSQKIPHQILLELTPKNSKAWAKVQGLSQNPRVRFRLTANRTLESVFKYLDKKWKCHRVRLKESLGATEESDEELICYLHPSCKITPVKLIPQEQQKVDVTFTSYRENILPTLQKLKKVKTVKEADKLCEDKDKNKDENVEEQGVVGKINSDSAGVCSSSKLKEGVDLIPLELQNLKSSIELPSTFADFLTTAADDIASFSHSHVPNVGQTKGQFIPADVPVRPKPPTGVVLEDENAMFPDYSSFSPPSCSFTETSDPSVILPSSPSSESSSLPPHQQPSVISSPTVGKKKPIKSSKKTTFSEEGIMPSENCDNNVAVSVSDNSSSPSKTELSTPAQDLKENLEKEIIRITTLAIEGFTLRSSNTVTLLHLSLILGRENVIRLEYDWREKRPHKVPLPPLLSQAASQMSNVLRRLCNLATLELTDFITSAGDQNKSSNKNVPCCLCGREGSTKSRGKRHTQAERKESTREIATMTDLFRVDPSPLTQVFQPTILANGGRTFVAAPACQAPLQIPTPDPVFRVPFTPTVKAVSSREEQLRLEEQQRVQLQAKAIMQQGPSPRNRLLKKRTLNPRNRKTPSIIVQRTLLPKVDTGQMVAYIQQPGPQSVTRPMVVEVAPENLVKLAQPMVNIMTCSAQPKTVVPDHILDNFGQRSDLLALAAQSAEISSDISPEKSDQSCRLSVSGAVEDLHQEESLFPLSAVATSTSSSLNTVHSEMASQTHGDISISDLEISMSSVTGSNLGPDAGDKFLDMVLQNSEQGFSGLITTPKKFTQSTESHQLVITNTRFDPSILRTPPHLGASNYLHSSSIFPSPIKLGISDNPWMSTDSGDISLSSVLGESSPFKSKDKDRSSEKSSLLAPSNYAAFFEIGSSDIPETGSITFSKPSTISDVSLSSLLGDTSFKKDDPGGVSFQISSPSKATSKSDSRTERGFFSDAINNMEPPQLFSEISQDSFAKLEVDRALQGIVSEGSLDLVSKFEFLAAHITGHQDRELSNTGDKQDKLLGGTGNMENVAQSI